MTHKEFRSYQEQVVLLKSRKMVVSNSQVAEHFLERVNYYRLSGYWYSFFNQEQDCFVKGFTFDDVIALYWYDKDLRICLFEILSEIELSMRALIGYELGRLDPFCYLDVSSMGARAAQFSKHSQTKQGASITNHENWLKHFNRTKDQSKEEFIKHYDRLYEGKMPIWVAVEIMDWGLLSHLYSLCPRMVQDSIANNCKLSAPQLESWLKSLNVARNYVAHHARMYNRIFTVKPKLPYDKKWRLFKERSNKIFAIIAMVVYLGRVFDTTAVSNVYNLIEAFPRNTRAREHTMGISINWQDCIDALNP